MAYMATAAGAKKQNLVLKRSLVIGASGQSMTVERSSEGISIGWKHNRHYPLCKLNPQR